MTSKTSWVVLALALALLALVACDGELTTPVNSSGVSNFELSSPGQGRVRLTWAYNTAGEDTINFQISRKVGDYDWDTSFGTTPNKLYEDQIPTNDSLVYAYMIRAINETLDETGDYSRVLAWMSAQTNPESLQVVQTGADKVHLSWQCRARGHDGFYIDKQVDGGSWQKRYRMIASDTWSFNDQVDLFHTVVYRVSAYKGDSQSGSVQDTIFTTLSAPTELTATTLDVTKVQLSWKDNSSAEQGFYLDRRLGMQPWQINYASVEAGVNSYVDDTNFDCATLTYRVRAFNGDYSSPVSDSVEINVRLNDVGSLTTEGNAIDVCFNGWYGFVADMYNGVVFGNFNNPAEPTYIPNNLDISDRTYATAMHGNYVVCASYGGTGYPQRGQLSVIDVSSMLFPQWVGYGQFDFIPYDIERQGDYIFVADNNTGFSVFDFNNAIPQQVAQCNLNATGQKVFINGSYAYVACGLDGLKVVDISQPLFPLLVANHSTVGLAADTWVNNGYAWLADGEDGIAVLDVSDPTQPRLVRRIDVGGFCNGISGESNQVFASVQDRGVIAIDATAPGSAFVSGWLNVEGTNRGIKHIGSYALLLDEDGVRFVQVRP